MGGMTDWFLRTKHWQIFLLVTAGGLPSLYLPLGTVAPNSAKPALLLELVAAFGACIFWAYLWSIGLFLNSIVPPANRNKTILFHASIIYSMLYAIGRFVLEKRIAPMPIGFGTLLTIGAFVCIINNLLFVSQRFEV